MTYASLDGIRYIPAAGLRVLAGVGDSDGVAVLVEDLLDAALVRAALLGLDVLGPRVVILDVVELVGAGDDLGRLVGLRGGEVRGGGEGALVVGCRHRQSESINAHGYGSGHGLDRGNQHTGGAWGGVGVVVFVFLPHGGDDVR